MSRSYKVEKKITSSDLLRKLENPLGFIGESRLSHVCYRNEWTSVSDLIRDANKDPRIKDRIMTGLRERLADIKEMMRDGGSSIQEARSLYEEGTAVKHALYVLNNNVKEDEDRHADTRRWIKFGRRMSGS